MRFHVWRGASIPHGSGAPRGRPRWGAYGANGSVVDMDSTKATTDGYDLIYWLSAVISSVAKGESDRAERYFFWVEEEMLEYVKAHKSKD